MKTKEDRVEIMKTLDVVHVPIIERSSVSRLRAVRTYLFTFSVICTFTSGTFTSAYADYGAGGCSTLRTPLVSGASYAAAGQAASEGAPPPDGCGNSPWPVTPGMTGAPTLEPWANRIPANQIDQQNSNVSVPFTPADAYPPGTVQQMTNPMLGGANVIPGPPSTPGADPGILRTPAYFYQAAAGVVGGLSSSPLAPLLPLVPLQQSSAAVVTVPPSGQYPDNMAPTTHRYGQTTRDFGLYRNSGSLTTDLGQRLEQAVPANVLTTLQYSADGSKPVKPHVQDPNVPKATVTHDYGIPFLIPVAVKNSNKRTPTAPLTTIAPY